MTTGTVFDIQRYSVHDGPGIRTTVFLKGCPLRCAWCHNPEGLDPRPQVLKSAAGERLCGRSYAAGELAELLRRTTPLFGDEGGVTFSGGEPTAQAEFVAEVMERLEGIHVALDTSGYCPEPEFRLAVERADLVLLDLKLIDPDEHRRWTGADNGPILANLGKLAGMGKPFVVRVPLVPGVTDTRENLRAVAETVKGLPGLVRVELLPYNRAAGGKYAACGREWKPLFSESLPHREDLTSFMELGVPARIA